MPSLRHNLLLPTLAASLALAAPASAATSSSWERTTVAHAKNVSVRAQADCDHADTRPTGDVSEATMTRSTVCLLNKQRARRGLRKLRLDARLTKAARQHTIDMVKRNYFSHNSRSGADVVDRLRDTGYMRGARSWTVGENLAWGSGTRSTPREIVAAWMKSPGHRSNILQRRFREIGIGVVFATPRRSGSSAGRAAATYTTTFGARS
jgi:uncharacterized protein YkwD